MFYLRKNSVSTVRRFAMGTSQKTNLNEFKYFLPIQSRWNDNDHQGHINNAVYYEYMDLVINNYLNLYCNFKGSRFMVHTSFDYYKPVKYPESFVGALMVDKIGRSSVQYKFGLYKSALEEKVKTIETNENTTEFSSRGILSQGDKIDFISKNYQQCPLAIGTAVHVFIDDKTGKPVTKMPTSLRKGLSWLTNEMKLDSKI